MFIPLQFDDVMSVYSGKAHKCCCGCSGKHTYSSQYRDVVSKQRGYEIDDDEVSDRTVKLIMSKINRYVVEDPASFKIFLPTESSLGSGYYHFDTGERWYIAYLSEAGRQRIQDTIARIESEIAPCPSFDWL